MTSSNRRSEAKTTRTRLIRYSFVIYPLLFCLLLSALLFFPFPAGADGGHMLALSYTFEGVYVEGPLKYPPIVPFLMFFFYRICFGNMDLVLTLIKLLGVALIFSLATAFYLLCKQLGKSLLAGKFGFFLALFNPLFLYEILWSGYAQFLGMTFAILAIFWLLKVEEGRNHSELLCALFIALTIGSHSYMSIFLCIFLFVYMSVLLLRRDNRWTLLRIFGKIGALSALFSIPFSIYYWNILNDLKTAPYPTSLSSFINSIRGEIIVSNPALGLALLVLAVIAILFYAKHYRNMHSSIETLLSLTIVAGLMFFLTPSISANRVLYLLMIPMISLIAMTLSEMRLPQRFFYDLRNSGYSGRKVWIEGLVLCFVALLALTSIIHYFYAINVFTPLGSNSLDAFNAIKRDSMRDDKVLVTSYWPEFDSWWMEGITRREALERGSLRWFELQSEVDRVILGKTLLFATYVIDGGHLKLLDNSPLLARYTHVIMTVSGAGAFGIIAIADDLSKVVAMPTADPNSRETLYSLSMGTPKIEANGSLFIKSDQKWGTLEKALSLNSDANFASIRYSLASNNCSISNMTLGIVGFDEILLENLRQDSSVFYIDYLHEWEGVRGVVQLEALSDAQVSGKLIRANMNDNPYLSLTFTPSSPSNSGLVFSLKVKVTGIKCDGVTSYSIYEKYEEAQVKYVYIRGETWLREKFERTPHFVVFFEEGDVIVYKYIPAS